MINDAFVAFWSGMAGGSSSRNRHSSNIIGHSEQDWE